MRFSKCPVIHLLTLSIQSQVEQNIMFKQKTILFKKKKDLNFFSPEVGWMGGGLKENGIFYLIHTLFTLCTLWHTVLHSAQCTFIIL